MVYIKSEITALEGRLFNEMNLSAAAYYFVRDKAKLSKVRFNLSEEEGVAVCGYKNLPVDKTEIDSIISKKPNKGFHFSDSVYKLVGIHLASGLVLQEQIEKKFRNTSVKNKFLIAQCLPEYLPLLRDFLSNADNQSTTVLLRYIYGAEVLENDIKDALSTFMREANDVIDLLILEDLARFFQDQEVTITKYLNKDALTLVIEVLENFDDAVKKIKGERRKGHESFGIRDEYDVQDLLYLVLKSIFPKLKEEDPTPRVGVKSNKIDLILREEGILIEVKMIKESDSSEKDFIEQLKNDIESYYECKWLKHLVCYVYDPFGKTKTKQNFYDLNGNRTIKDISFSVEVILGR